MLRNMLEEEARSILDYIYTSIFKAYKIEFLDSKKAFNLYININIILYALYTITAISQLYIVTN